MTRAQQSPEAATPKPMAKAARVALFFREVRERLSDSAVDLLLNTAQVLSEGQPAQGGRDFFGTVMLTVDLGRVRDLVREPCDAATAQRVAAMMGTDTRVRRRVQQIARTEAQRLAPARPAAIDVDVTARASGTKVFIDADFQARGRTA